MGVTIRDVADEAGVSATTVSRVFNHGHLVNQDTRDHVMEVARRMGYAPNETARSLSHGRTHSLGVLLPAPHGEFFSEFIRGLDEVAQEANHFLLIAGSHYDPDEGASALTSLAGRVDGLVIMTPRIAADQLLQGLDLDIPAVFVNSELGDTSFDLFTIENRAGARQLVAHLIETGHHTIAAVTGPRASADVEGRMAGYQEALTAHNLDEGPILEGAFTQESGYEAGREMAHWADLPDAVFAFNDYMAIGIMAALQEEGVRVPEDVAVAGFDDIEYARYANPSLTTVRVPVYEIGRQAGRRIIQRVEADDAPSPEAFNVAHELKIRASTVPQAEMEHA
jgi:LacI family transcriptional regulator